MTLLLPLVAAHTAGAASEVRASTGSLGTWTRTANMGVTRDNATAVALKDGRVLVMGGIGYDVLTPRKSAELYDPATGTWSRTGDMSLSRAHFVAVRLLDGRVLVAGGIGPPPRQIKYASAEIYDPATGTWSPTGSMTTFREYLAATLLPDGRVLVEGGYGNQELASAELYDPATGTWSATGSMAVPRYWQSATLLNDGRVLVAGGFHYIGSTAATASAEIYDPATGTWSAAKDMLLPRISPSATRLPDGRVLVVGGYNGPSPSPTRSAEIYDPVAGIWTRTEGMLVPRADFTLTSLPDGRDLAAGGGIHYKPTASAEVFDPASETWSRVADMNTVRQGHVAALLPDGRVLVAGGFRETFPHEMASAEVYDPAGA